MIPILQNGSTVVGFLPDTLTCVVTEERNGIYELTMTYPVTGSMFSELKVDRFVKAKPNDTSDNQLFRIYEITKPINGIVTINAEHVSYALSHYPINDVSVSGNAYVAINTLLTNARNNLSKAHGFSVATSDITAVKTFTMTVGSVRSALGGVKGSVLDTYGGEYEFDNYVIRLHKNRGKDTGVIVSYGKNLTDIKVTTSMEKCYTHLFPYCLKDEKLTMISARRIAVANNSGIAERVLIKDFTSSFGDDEEITAATLLTKANAWLADNDINTPSINVTVSFLHLWQSPEYATVAALEKVSLCDYVTVRHNILGVDIKAQVIKTVYDTLAERYTKIELGSAKANFADTIKQTSDQLKDAMNLIEGVDTSALESEITAAYQKAIDDATAAITGSNGGYVVLNPSKNPQELLVMNTNSIDTATKLWRWNLNGLGYSSNGYNGPYTTAITMNGAINADFITTGSLTANIIKAGVLTSVDGTAFFNLETGVIQTSKANITGGTIRIGGDSYYTEIANGSLGQFLQSSGGLVGGLVPTGAGGAFSQTLYFNGKSDNVTDVLIAYQNESGSYTQIARFGKDNIELSDSTKVYGDFEATGIGKFGGAGSFGGNLTVTGGATIGGNTSIDGTLKITTIYTLSNGGYYLGNQMNITNSGISMIFQTHDSSYNIYENGRTNIGTVITTKSANFSGLTHTRTNASINANPYDGRIKAGLGIATYSFAQSFSSYSNISSTNKTSGGFSYYARTGLTDTTTYYTITNVMSAYAISSIELSFNASSYGKAYVYFVARDSDGHTLKEQLLATPWNTDTSYSGTITMPEGAYDYFIAVTPDTGSTNYWAGWRNVSLRTYHQKPSAALEAADTDGTIRGRLDVFESWGSAIVVLRANANGSTSAALELGSSQMWWNGNLVTTDSSEKFKTNIVDYDDSAVDIINASKLYSYRYIGENGMPIGKTKYGLVIERECPKEVIDNSGDSIALYSMTSLAWKAIQELSEKLSRLEEKVNGS